MRSKRESSYRKAYSLLYKMFLEANLNLDTISLITDAEINIWKVFEEIFSPMARILIYGCCVHFTRNITSNLKSTGLFKMTLKQSCFYDQNVFNFAKAIQKMPYLPQQLIVQVREYLIAAIQAKGIESPEFFSYLRRRVNFEFGKKSFYDLILQNEKYTHLSTNYSESYNSSLNTFCRSLSRSKKLVNIIKNIRCYSISEYRTAETQFLSKSSFYKPCKEALLNYKYTRRFVLEIQKIDFRSRQCVQKICRLMHPKNFYSPINGESEDFGQNFSF